MLHLLDLPHLESSMLPSHTKPISAPRRIATNAQAWNAMPPSTVARITPLQQSRGRTTKEYPMTSLKLGAVSALFALFASGCISSNEMNMNHNGMTAADHQMMSTCMSMTANQRATASQCTSMMRRMSLSETDMMTMNRCHAMSHDAMMRDEDCVRMSRMHPGMATHQ
jgi:hypothetical protein